MQIKICEKCFLCHSFVLCQYCYKCTKCCPQSICRGQASELLENLAGSGRRSKGSTNPQRGLQSLPFRIRPKLVRFPTVISCYVNPQRNSYLLEALHQLNKYRQKCSRDSKKPNISELFQQIVSSQSVETYLGSEQSEFLPQGGEIQDGDSGNHQDITPTRGVDHLHRLQGCMLPHPNTGTVQEISEISCSRTNIPIQSPTIRTFDSTTGVHCSSKGGQTDGYTQGYKDPPVPRRLVGESRIPSSLSPTHSRAGTDMPKVRLASKLGKIGTEAQTNLQFCRLPVRPEGRSGPAYTGPVADPPRENIRNPVSTGLSGPAVHVPDWSANSHRKASLSRPASHETHTVAPQKQLESAGSTGEGHSGTQISSPSFGVVVGRTQCTARSTTASVKTRTANLYRCVKRRVGCSPWRTYRKRFLVSTRKQPSHKLSGAEGSPSSPKRVPRSLYGQNCPSGHGQYNSSSLHKQGGRYEVRPTLCPSMENLDLVYQPPGNAKSPTHPRPSKCDSGQVIQAGSNHPDRMVSPSGSLSKAVQKMAPSSDRSICHEVQPQVTSICVSSTGLPSCSNGCPHSHLGRSGCICLPTDHHIGQSGGEIAGFPVQETHSDCTGVAQHALVLGFGDHVKSSPSQPAQHDQPVDTALQSDPSQKSDKSKSPFLSLRATAIKEQGFSEAVASRIEAPQRRSTRSVYEAKWTIFTKWCITHQVDFRSPPIKSVADFLLYLFEDKKLQPSTIDGYRSAIADKLGNVRVNISKDDNLTRLLESFHRDRPKGRRGIPSWNLSLVLHQLTKAPFEPLREASLKHLTFKTTFLLALGSGKRRSEIHAWQHKNIRHQSDWSKVSLYPSPSFLSKNQLAKEGPGSVAPVVIPALAPTLDKSLRSDRSLCPVRALRYYLDRTSDLRQNKELVFVSFKKGFDKDISPATISSWIKQTVILCYELSDHQAHTLHQVKAHDVRAFAASKAFQSGVSLDQILAACHWKSHNTFTQFYLKDVAWADSELFHLGPVVAAQQIHQ